MEEMYLLEFLVKNVSLHCKSGKLKSQAEKKITVNINFGLFASFIINETEFEKDLVEVPDDEVAGDPSGLNNALEKTDRETPSNFTLFEMDLDEYDKAEEREFNSGASIIFAHNPDGLKQTFRLFPLEISVWNNDSTERRACVGSSKISWDNDFFETVTKSSRTCRILPPTTVKAVHNLRSEVSGSVIGEMTSLIRLTNLGKKVITRFKQADGGDGFVFRNRAGNASHRCKKYGLQTKPEQIRTIGVIYESVEMEDPDAIKATERKRQVSEELKAAGLNESCVMFITGEQMKRSDEKDVDVPLPCGNANCMLTKMIQSYLSQDRSFKPSRDPRAADHNQPGKKDDGEGAEEPYSCGPNPADQPKYVICEVCGGYSNSITCKDKLEGYGPCPGPCYLNDPKPENANLQKMLQDGLGKMLCRPKSDVQREACPDFSQMSANPPCGRRCCR